jgi:hypothetical protein
MSAPAREQTPPRQANWFTQSSLRQSFRRGECLICSNVIASERRSIHSFLYEGMMSPGVRKHFLKGGGFCPRHFWIAKRIEEECWRAGGIGVAILCENLMGQIPSELPAPGSPDRKRVWRGVRRGEPLDGLRLPGFACGYCQENEDRERSLLPELERLLDQQEWSAMLQDAPLCLRHAWLASRLWQRAEARGWLCSRFQDLRKQLANDLQEFIRKHDWQHRDEPLGRERDAVPRAIRFLVGLERQFPGGKP